jgi:aspartate/methionine/tyrosine aminotransferase
MQVRREPKTSYVSSLIERGILELTTLKEIWDITNDLWDPNTNPDGYVSLGLAENSLMHDELLGFLNSKQFVDDKAHGLTYGDGPFGSKRVKAVIASFLNTHLHSASELKPEHIFVTNGVSSAIEHCAWTLANPGEGILLGRPYYRAFLPDIGMRTGVQVVPVPFGQVDPCHTDCVQKYEEALLRSNDLGVPVRALMLCHPHNPLGRCYPRDTLIGLMKLCQKYQIHLISDEIYALSTWENTVDGPAHRYAGFESVLSINVEGIIDPSLVHVLWGVSKDFGANGLRLGALMSQSNQAFLAALRTCSLYSSPSSLTENAVVHLLTNTSFVESYIAKNQARLSAAYAQTVRALREHGIEHMPGGNAAFFLWVNLGKFVREKTRLGENEIQEYSGTESTQLIQDRLKAKRVYLVPGDAVGAEEPGWFRIVFTHREELVAECVRRIVEALGTK